MLCRLGEAGSTLGQWDDTSQCNLLLMSSSRLRSNQGLLKTHESGSLYLPFDPCTFDCSSYLSLHKQDPVSACHLHLVLRSLLSHFLGGVVASTELAENCSILSAKNPATYVCLSRGQTAIPPVVGQKQERIETLLVWK